MELPFNFPANDAEAARFLNQATFGATAADIQAVRNQSVAVWLEGQLNSPTTTLSRNWLERYAAALTTGEISQADRVQRWYDVAVRAPDQVRQKMAYALSQIVVASDFDATLSGEEIMMAEWNDIIVRNAMGNYRTLMREVTYSPMMGIYLTTRRNQKFQLNRVLGPGGVLQGYTAGNNGVQPDENYAREVMQLFSIGLLLRNNDFSLVDGDAGIAGIQAVPTYDEDTISELARVFTGLSHNCSGTRTITGTSLSITRSCGTGCSGPSCRFTNFQVLFGNDPPRQPDPQRGIVHPDWYEPMVCYPRYNDNGRDTSGQVLPDPQSGFELPAGTPTENKSILINGTAALNIGPSVVPGGSAPLNCHLAGTTGPQLTAQQQQDCINYCEGNIDAAIDRLFNHPNTPVMVSRQLIQRLVTSNPTPGYIERVSAVFRNNGSGVRGDLKAVARAILLDAEARRPFNDPLTASNFGKSREPLLKLVQVWRNFGYVNDDDATIPAGDIRRRWGPTNPEATFQQRPLGAPSVFNFFEPDYKQPGAISTLGLFSPEFQILHEVSTVNTANELYARVCSGYGNNDCSAGTNVVPGSGTRPRDRAFLPSTVIDTFPTTNTADAQSLANVIEFYNTRMFGGTMGGEINLTAGNDCFSGSLGSGTKGILYRLLRCSLTTNEGGAGITGGSAAEQNRRRHLYLIHLAAISPEFSTQR
jgi:uncharacterized protein (DUF1800 family)